MNWVAVLTLTVVVAANAYRPSADAGVISTNAFNSIRMGEAKRLADLSPFKAETICLLQPYQDRLPSEHPYSARVNQYLVAEDYRGDESHFAFVLVGKDGIEIAAFARSKQLDVLAKHGVSLLFEKSLPKGFQARNCASGGPAAIAKTSLKERTYVVLGEIP
jgi:hypothetical protein